MSSLSPVGICRRALQRVGVTDTISSIEDPTSEEEVLCATCYDDIRLKLLRDHTWNFAKKRVQISAEITAPIFQYENSYQLPNDFVRLIQIGDTQADRKYIDFSLENGYLLVNNNTNETAGILDIVYIFDEKEVAKWDTLFRELMRLKIAHTIAYPLTRKNALVAAIDQELKDATPKSQSVDSQDTQIKRVETSKILRSRRSRCGRSPKYNSYNMEC